MRLLRASEVPWQDRETVYRHSPARAALVALALAAAGLVLAWLLSRDGSVLGFYVAALALLALVVLRRLVLAPLRGENWLVRQRDDGLYVHFRSYLNYHFPAGDTTVVHIPYSEIRSARQVRERMRVPSREGPAQSRTLDERRRRLVELELNADTAALAKALDEELARRPPMEKAWYGSSGTTYRDYPVRLASSGVLQLEWNVAPGETAFLDSLRMRTLVGSPGETVRDFTSLGTLDRVGQEGCLRELAASGETIAAIDIAMDLYGLDLKQAKDFVEGLRRGASL
jgi:hypothetical protein